MRTKSLQFGAMALAALLQACASPHGRPDRTAPRPAPDLACGDGAALTAELREPGSALLFGEIHGVEELPMFFGEAVCTTAVSGLPVEVGLELPNADQAVVDVFLASSGAPSRVEALTATPFWSRDFQDGRSSEARVVLLQRMRFLRAQGLPIRVVLFDVNAATNQADREKGMADNLAAHVRAHPEALTMVLVGEVHSWKSKGAPWDPELLPMGWHLTQVGLHVRSLGRSTPAGTAWFCTGGSPGDCGRGETKATHPLPSGRREGIEMLSEPSTRGYDGLYATASLTASPPARSDRNAGHRP